MIPSRIARTSGILLALSLALPGCDDGASKTDGGAADALPGDLPPGTVSLVYDFAEGQQGWSAGFADYPAGEEAFYELASAYQQLPAPLGSNDKAIMIAGMNRSDDLFMYIKRKVGGLAPSTKHSLVFEVVIATDAPKGCIGVGGAPGESVFVKAGASSIEPEAVIDPVDNHLRMNIDKGNQEPGGTDAITIGDCASTNTDCAQSVYQLKTLTSAGRPFSAASDAAGDLWLLVGTDSGYEGKTTLYYVSVKVIATPD